jgi:hypothetical protein
MQRQFAQFVCPNNISNEMLFERHGDDNLNYFIDPLQQFVMQGGLAPLGIDTPTTPQLQGNNSYNNSVSQMSQVRQISTISSALISATPQHFLLQPGASLKVFLDSWQPWQTVPVLAQVSAKSAGGRYSWYFGNYVPIQGSPSGSGEANICPQGVEADIVIRTLGHLNRTPLGEFPVTQVSRVIYESRNEINRPYLMFNNVTTQVPLQFDIKEGGA